MKECQAEKHKAALWAACCERLCEPLFCYPLLYGRFLSFFGLSFFAFFVSFFLSIPFDIYDQSITFLRVRGYPIITTTNASASRHASEPKAITAIFFSIQPGAVPPNITALICVGTTKPSQKNAASP